MKPVAYINGHVLVGRRLVNDLVIIVKGDRIEHVGRHNHTVLDKHRVVDLGGYTLLPGFIDAQVNGGGGVLFNESTSVTGIRTMSKAHCQFGTTGFLPTLISDDLDVVRQGTAAVDEAIELGVPGVLGIHLEGPFLAHDRRGVHDVRKLQSLTHEIIGQLEPARHGKSLLTLAPETVTPEMVRLLVGKGFIVSAGHSNASFEQVNAAIEQGLRGVTHLFNAMSQLGSREPGMVGAALDGESTWCGIIADNHHVSPASVRIAYRCKGPEKLMLITDAMPPVGSDQRTFTLHGKTITVSDGICRDSDGTLAGAALDMVSAVHNIMKITDCSLVDASHMASTGPAAFLGLSDNTGSIKAGNRADFVILDDKLDVRTTLIGGEVVYSKN